MTQIIQDQTLILPYCQAAAEWFVAERARLTALGRMHSGWWCKVSTPSARGRVGKILFRRRLA
ncbi:hypothetical protein [Laspinema olomoucense]|uniref:Uncharacterized protein n=1 Tax=Laspinema olomoucense D3b TaxID=2953688 RepID=A0ABT2N4V3_9CYAN|nr:hypothetical protein [Laspinema sp. D3b]MCT7977726.1 hypothetical protein [Laspinema sp. D3b]